MAFSIDIGLPIPAFLLAVIGGGLFGVSCLYFVRTLYSTIVVHYFQSTFWRKIVPRDEAPVPDQLETVETILRQAGMEFLGVLRARGRSMPQPHYDTWIYVSADGYTYAEVMFDFIKPVILAFVTIYPDQAVITTRYPLGDNIVTPQFVSRFANHSIEAAWNYQQQQIETRKAASGAPVVIRSLQDVVDTGEVYKKLYRRLDSRHALRLNLTATALWLGLLLASLGLLITSAFVAWGWMAGFVVLTIGAGALLRRGWKWIDAQFANPPGAVDAASSLPAQAE